MCVCVCALTLIVQLEHAHASLRRGAVEDGQSVGGTADHLTFHQQSVIGQDEQGASFVCAPDGQLLALRQVHTLHLKTHTGRHTPEENSAASYFPVVIVLFRFTSCC